MNSQGLVKDSESSNINFVNVDNLFTDDKQIKLSYEDYAALSEDFATMHINEDLIDQIE